MHPKLRSLDIRPITQENHPYILLRDPLQISEHQLLVPQPLAAVLAYCDGHHAIDAMLTKFEARYRMTLPADAVVHLIAALDDASMLETERVAKRCVEAMDRYRRAPCRPPALAGSGYPDDRTALWRLLQEYLESSDQVEAPIDWSHPVGVLSPHIDYLRGGKVYADVWKHAAQAAREAEQVILLGTDHYGAELFTLTRQCYATPYGVLPTDTAMIDRLASVLGEQEAFAGELRHRSEHSLELVAVWLHHMRAGVPVPVVPILTGSFHSFLVSGDMPDADPRVAAALAVLTEGTAGRRTLIIASGDLAHVGPAFGGAPLNSATRRALRAADEELIAAMRDGDTSAFFASIRRVRNRNNVCGTAPIYLMLRLLGESRGSQAGYAVCPADDEDTSVVTVTGMLFSESTVTLRN